MVIAPEHPLLDSLTSPEQREAVQAYVSEATSKSDLQRTELQKQKTGVATGTILTSRSSELTTRMQVWNGACKLGRSGERRLIL